VFTGLKTKKVLSLDLRTDRESLMGTVCGSEFQTHGTENAIYVYMT